MDIFCLAGEPIKLSSQPIWLKV